MIVTIDKNSHDARIQTGPGIAQNHLDHALHKKHDIPLFVGVGPGRIVIRFMDEETAQPVGRLFSLGNAGRMNVESLGRVGEHARGGPLRGPKIDLREDPLIAPDKFAEHSAEALRVNFPGQNFHSRDPGLGQRGVPLVHGHQFSRLHPVAPKAFRERGSAVIPRSQLSSRFRRQSLPKFVFAIFHFGCRYFSCG